jgi:hypothetical protein
MAMFCVIHQNDNLRTSNNNNNQSSFKKSFTPSSSSMMSLPTLANVVHLQLLMALTAHLLCDLNLQTSQLNPCDVTPDFKKFIYISGKFKI